MNYNVIICGGGLAGLCLARQLRSQNDELSIAVLEQLERPLPGPTLKVGESSIEVGAYYFNEVMGLESYIDEFHHEKLGLRYFYGSSTDTVDKRPEYGVSEYLPAKSVQLNRGRFEEHLRMLVCEEGIDLIEGATVKDIVFGEGEEPHEVTFQVGEDVRTISGRWVVDASGRRKLIQRKLNLSKANERVHSSVWFRIDGVLDVAELAAKENIEWHEKVKERRWLSTNHLMGEGYWVWLIPINPECTSVGIVTTEECHPFAEYATLKKAKQWIAKNEPLLAPHLEKYEVLDFKAIRNYSYSSHQVFSEKRWTCVGEAGAFVDPYYSIGSNMIAYSNGITCKLIEMDLQNKLTKKDTDYFNKFYLTLIENLAHNIQSVYPILNKPRMMVLKTIWDFEVALGISDVLYYEDIYLDPKMSAVVSQLTSPIFVTQAKLIKLYLEWAKYPESPVAFDFVDYIKDLPTLTDLLVRNTQSKERKFVEILDNIRYAMDRLEELAHVIFFMAVEDTMPEQMARFEENGKWININAISLDPSKWEEDKLFVPETSPRDFSKMEQEIKNALNSKTLETIN
ncbi:NAD(P)/FAD-dependent oxidoreductase [Fulvivirga sp. 29W222]|uniref:NAD(P)/FAD-dependent oxidoreductase n=1 Tax=Fulvivirga marina TaxID=2494733 RepID=A0A937FZS5_9BACT|nr:NAD(P)/FAD-dependent oxidoreductase [Fulvivirga marina]MBL6449155.1 NAD(P)/FAD-dependent oxidoreductase [Fulvivirga marina]